MTTIWWRGLHQPRPGIDRQIIRSPELLITSGEAIREMRAGSVSPVTICQWDKGHRKGRLTGFRFPVPASTANGAMPALSVLHACL
ncbi:hypothetical protein JZ751_024260 [Albula glossodonta]|uniref:Uncharacterized protein n=1 Tax=Albula glossodonta TaxID=121402 RepID=A0A8T2NN72_9TELE|nr:hypothetical protein JZ751_024260 [Albula glossodonta]